MEHLIRAHRQPVGLLELGVEPLCQARVRAEQAAPGAKLPKCQGLLLGVGDLDGCDGRHGGPIQTSFSSEHSSACAPRAGDRAHRRVARQAHSIISGCSGRRAYSAHWGILRKRSGSRAMYTLAGNTAASSAIRPSPDSRRVAGMSTPTPPAISATPLSWTISLAWLRRLGGTI